MVDAVPCANKLNGASVDSGGATGALLARKVFIPLSDCSIERSTPNIAVGSVDVNAEDSVGSLARKTNITDNHNPVINKVLK